MHKSSQNDGSSFHHSVLHNIVMDHFAFQLLIDGAYSMFDVMKVVDRFTPAAGLKVSTYDMYLGWQ